MSNTPLWRQAYNNWEKAVAPGLQEMTASPGFQDFLALAAQVNTSIASELEQASRQWLHLWNLPAASDVRSLRRQVASLEREIGNLQRSLARANEQLAEAAPAKQAKPAKPAAKKATKATKKQSADQVATNGTVPAG